MKSKINQRMLRKKRVKAKLSGTTKRPRISVFRSNKSIYAQLIDDVSGKTLISASNLKNKKSPKEVGIDLAKKAKEAKITDAVFDKSGYKYHGQVKDLAEGAREGGLKF